MNLHILRTDEEYQKMLELVDIQFDLEVSPESKNGEDLQIALLLIKQYEDIHFPIPKPNPLLAISKKCNMKA